MLLVATDLVWIMGWREVAPAVIVVAAHHLLLQAFQFELLVVGDPDALSDRLLVVLHRS